MHLHLTSECYAGHVLGGNEDVLLLVGRAGAVNLQSDAFSVCKPFLREGTYHHPHTDTTVDGVHEHIELVKAT